MRLEPSASSRRVIVPWYDADGICIATMVLLFMVLGFGTVGILVALAEPMFNGHVWVPAGLTAASALIFCTIGLRLFKRRRGQR